MPSSKQKRVVLYSLLFIFLLALFWRFVYYSQRWVLNQDQARDVTIALHAIRNQKIPLLGSPSSAGPFSFGPLYDWLIIISTLLFPFVSGPWVSFTLLSAATCLIFFQIGKNYANPKLGLIMALITAFSSAHVANAPDMLNTVIVAFFTSLAFLFLQKFYQEKKEKYLVFLGISIGTAMNCHFQSLGLFSLLLLSPLLNRFSLPKKLRLTTKVATGFLISFLPLIYFDLHNRFVWFQSVFHYYTGGQNKFYIPIRWLTDLRDFWPQLWGNTITALPWSGYLFLFLAALSFYLSLKKKIKLSSGWWILAASFLIQILLIRYYKGVRSPEYLITFQPYFIFFTSWSLWIILQRNKLVGSLLIFLTLALATFSNLKIIRQLSQAPLIFSMKKDLDQLYPHQNIAFYTQNGSDMVNLPIFYLFYRNRRIDPAGQKIGTCREDTKKPQIICPPSDKIISQNERYTLFDLSYLSDQELSDSGYQNYTSENIYNRLFVNYPQAIPNSP